MFDLPFPSFDKSPNQWMSLVSSAASLQGRTSDQVFDRFQRKYLVNGVVRANHSVLLLGYIVLPLTICLGYIYFVLRSRIWRKTSSLPPGPQGLPVFGSFFRLRAARRDPAKFADFVSLILVNRTP